jgi:hypothetical protein
MSRTIDPAHSTPSYARKVIVGVRIGRTMSKNLGRPVALFEEEVTAMLEKANSSY